MSGGSFNYLCYSYDSGGIDTRREDIENMARALEEEGYHDAANETREIIRSLDALIASAARMADPWHAMEWYRSCDYGSETFHRVMAECGYTRYAVDQKEVS